MSKYYCLLILADFERFRVPENLHLIPKTGAVALELVPFRYREFLDKVL